MTAEPIALIEELPMAVEDLWALWTEPERVTRWLAGGANIDLKVGGMYQIFGHLVDRPLRESVGGPILGLEEEYVLKVAWKLPSELGSAAGGATPPTTLGVWFQPMGPARTRLRLEHDGWRDGEEWAAARSWHSAAWTTAFERLKKGGLPT